MSIVDPDELAKVVPQAVADALLALIGAAGKHKVPMAALLTSPEIDRFQRQEAEIKALSKALTNMGVLATKQRKLIEQYEAQLGIDNEI